MLFFVEETNFQAKITMNTPQIRDAQFQQHPHYDDEISLVDLAKTLIKRRWWFLGVSFLVVALALVYALANRTGPAYNYISIYELAKKTPEENLETTSSVLEKINSMHWPSYRRDYMQANNLTSTGELPFTFALNNPKDTNLIIFTTIALEENKELSKQLHQNLLEKVMADQNTVFHYEKNKLTKQIAATKQQLDQLKNTSGSKQQQEQIIANQTQRLFELEDKLNDLQEGKLIQLSAQDERAKLKKLSGSLVLALGIVLGGLLGVMAAFFAEFAAQVRKSLQEETE